jgi:hypothetical protein
VLTKNAPTAKLILIQLSAEPLIKLAGSLVAQKISERENFHPRVGARENCVKSTFLRSERLKMKLCCDERLPCGKQQPRRVKM